MAAKNGIISEPCPTWPAMQRTPGTRSSGAGEEPETEQVLHLLQSAKLVPGRAEVRDPVPQPQRKP